MNQKHRELATVNQASVHVCATTVHSFEVHNEAASAKLVAENTNWLINPNRSETNIINCFIVQIS